MRQGNSQYSTRIAYVVLVVSIASAVAFAGAAATATTPASPSSVAGILADDHEDQPRPFASESLMVFTQDGTVELNEQIVYWEESEYQQELAGVTAFGFDNVSHAHALNTVEQQEYVTGYSIAQDAEVDGIYETRWGYSGEQYNVGGNDLIDVTVEDGQIRVNVSHIAPEHDFEEQLVRLEMPGEIVDSNALEINGTTAIWDVQQEAPHQLTVVANIDGDAATDGADDNTGNDEGDTADDDGAGFGIGLGVASLVTGLLWIRHRRT